MITLVELIAVINRKNALPILRLLETPGVGPAKVRSILEWTKQKGMEPEELLTSEENLLRMLSVSQMEALRDNYDTVFNKWYKLNDMEVTFLTSFDDGYPRSLRSSFGEKAPPLIMALGNISLLDVTSVGFCGSRKASDKGLATANDCAKQLATSEVNIISGYAAGVDMTTHKAALASGGTTTIVLAEGILNFRIKRELASLWDWQRTVVISEFLPGITWSVRNAMQRNRTICALSGAMVLIEAGLTGGSIEAGRVCLGMGKPLFAPVYEGIPESAVGNRDLLTKGARPLLKSKGKDRANIKPILEVILASEKDRMNVGGGSSRVLHQTRMLDL